MWDRTRCRRLVTRAVIDPAKGLLYAATTTANAALGSMQYDQAAGVGDVDVYDLNAIRDGKVATGADLKPLGTFLVGSGKKIHGLELTPDGKTLIVLTTTTSTNAKNTPKSFLTQYDTETRKPTDGASPRTCRAGVGHEQVARRQVPHHRRSRGGPGRYS